MGRWRSSNSTPTATNLHGSANGGIGLQPSAKGFATFGTPRVNGVPVRGALHGFVGTAALSGTSPHVGYLDHAGPAPPSSGPAQPTDGGPIPVLGDAGRRRGSRPGGSSRCRSRASRLLVRVVGVIRRFPSIVGDAVVADRQTRLLAVRTRSPGLGTTDESGWTAADAGSGDRCPPRPGRRSPR